MDNNFLNKIEEIQGIGFTNKKYRSAVQAIEMAKNKLQLNRFYLYGLYDYAMSKDEILRSLYQTRISRILSLGYTFSKNKKDITSSLQYGWFDDIVRNILDSIFYGNSLFAITYDNTNISIFNIPRENVIPELKLIKVKATDSVNSKFKSDSNRFFSYENEPNIVDVNYENNPKSLGLLEIASPKVIMKEQNLLNWGEYIETYIQPMIIASTTTQDSYERDIIKNELQNAGRRRAALLDAQTEFKSVQFGNGSDVKAYETFKQSQNDDLATLILGSTMLTSDGSSYGQAQIHQNTSFQITMADIRFVERIINEQVIPVLIRVGYLASANTYNFKLNSIENRTEEEKQIANNVAIEQANFIIQNLDKFEIDEKEFINAYPFIQNIVKGFKNSNNV